MNKQDKKLLSPETNVLSVSSKTNLKSTLFIAKVHLKKFEEIELHSLGEAINHNVKLVEQLQRAGIVEVQKVEQKTIVLNESEHQKMGDKFRPIKKMKLIIKVKRTPLCLEKLKTIQ